MGAGAGACVCCVSECVSVGVSVWAVGCGLWAAGCGLWVCVRVGGCRGSPGGLLALAVLDKGRWVHGGGDALTR